MLVRDLPSHFSKGLWLTVACAIPTLMMEGMWFEELPTSQSTSQREGHQKELQKPIFEMTRFRHWGLLAQKDRDMGDTLQRTGSYYTLLKYLGAPYDDVGRPLVRGYLTDMNKLMASPGVFRRSNDPTYWGYNPDNCSRDQVYAALAAIVTFHDFERGQEVFSQFAQRFFFNQNTRDNWAYPWEESYRWKFPDPPSPSQLSLLLRGLGNRSVYPLVFILDVFILADVKFFRKQNDRELWDYDIKSLPGLIAANSYLPTPWSRWGLQLYLEETSDIESRIQYYNQSRFNGIQPLADLYQLTLKDLNRYQAPFFKGSTFIADALEF